MKGGKKTMDEMEKIYQEYGDMIKGMLLNLCHDEFLSEEITQETFFQAFLHYRDFRGGSLSAWLCTIAKRLYFASLRKSRALSLEEVNEPCTPDFADALVSSDQAMRAQHILHHLAEPYREVFTLRTWAELNHSQIAELFGKSESWARVTYYRARQMLAEELKKEMNL